MKAKDAGDESSYAIWVELQMPQNRAQFGEVWAEHRNNVPMDTRYRKWLAVCMVQLRKKYSKFDEKIADLPCYPFTKMSFLIRAQNKQELSES